MADYQHIAESQMILRTADGAHIPPDPANKDYAAYLEWAAAGNTADPAPVMPPPSTISTAAFVNRFTSAEQAAIQTAAETTPSIGLGLTMGLAKGTISLVGDPVVVAWMNALVSANCITSARMTAILTP